MERTVCLSKVLITDLFVGVVKKLNKDYIVGWLITQICFIACMSMGFGHKLFLREETTDSF